MPGMRQLHSALAALLVARGTGAGGAAMDGTEAAQAKPAVGRIYEYVRTNRDGTLPERIVMFRRTATEIEVYKAVSLCNNAAYVTGIFDPATLEARTLHAGRVAKDGSQQRFGRLDYDPARRLVIARIDLPDGAIEDEVEVPDRPWHLYDFDLASLNVWLEQAGDLESGFSFGMPLVVVSDDPGEFLSYLGRADARYVGRETRHGRDTLRFEVSGPALGDKGGPMWIDAKGRFLVDVEWGLPNHREYRDFKLLLRSVSEGGEAEWKRILAAHHADC